MQAGGAIVALGLVFGACGGKSDHADESATDAGSGGSNVSDAGNGGSNAGSGGNGAEPGTGAPSDGGAPEFEGPVESIDEVDGSALDSDPESSHFFWSWGIGNWFVEAPEPNPIHGDAHSAEIEPPRGESNRAFRVQGTGHSRGVDLWAQLSHPQGNALDLGSTYLGIVFWARLDGASDRLLVGANPGGSYFDAPDDVPTVELSVSGEWQQFVVPFDVWPGPENAVASFDFIVGEGGGDFDFWLDDLGFLCRHECPATE